MVDGKKDMGGSFPGFEVSTFEVKLDDSIGGPDTPDDYSVLEHTNDMGVSTERVILSHIIKDKDFCSTVIHTIKDEWFEGEGDRIVFGICKEHHKKYNAIPTWAELDVELSKVNALDATYADCRSVVQNLAYDEKVSGEWLIRETQEWCIGRAIYRGVQTAIAIEEGESKLTRAVIPDIMREALSVSFINDLGHDYFNDYEEFYDNYYFLDGVRYPFLIKKLNDYTRGGPTTGTLNLILAGINVGKSLWLLDQACEQVLAGHNVVYFTLEMSEEVCRERADVRMLDIVFGDVDKMSKEEYIEKIEFIRATTKGNLIIKDFPPGTATTHDFDNFIKELKIRKDFVPKFIMVDYLTLVASCDLHPSMKGNSNTYYGAVATELRALFKKLDVIGWSACQVGRAKQNSEDIGLSDIALAMEIAAIADFVISAIVSEAMKELNQAGLTIIKNRYHFIKAKFVVGLDVKKQMFFDLDEYEQQQKQDMNNQKAIDIGQRFNHQSMGGSIDQAQELQGSQFGTLLG